jgi:hypothetical protein
VGSRRWRERRRLSGPPSACPRIQLLPASVRHPSACIATLPICGGRIDWGCEARKMTAAEARKRQHPSTCKETDHGATRKSARRAARGPGL